MSSKKNLLSCATTLALVGFLGACNSGSDAKPMATQSRGIATAKTTATGAVETPPPPADAVSVPAAAAVSASGPVSITGFTHEDGTAMTSDEMAAAIAMFPDLGTNYTQLQSAVRADESSGIVTLWDASGNVILVIPTAGVGTIRNVQVTANAESEQGACTSGGLVFDLNDSAQPAADQSQAQAQAQAQGQSQTQSKDGSKQVPAAVQSAGFLIQMTMGCDAPKQTQDQSKDQSQAQDQSKGQPADQSKGQPADQSKGQPADQSKGQPADQSKGQPADQSKGQPADQSKGQPADQSKGQPADQSKGQPQQIPASATQGK